MKNPSLEIIVTERCSTGGCPLEEACEHCYLIQSAISVAISYIISVYCEDYAGYFTVILSFLAFQLCSAYFIYLVSCNYLQRCFLHFTFQQFWMQWRRDPMSFEVPVAEMLKRIIISRFGFSQCNG
jgi:hypothetical protein